MMAGKVSIIVGIYNVAHFLREKRLNCIIQQTYKNWELLLVDDGSTDDSGQICEELSFLDTRIRVIHKENGGLGSARNAGLDLATGEYVWFYDVDDEASLELLEYCVNKMDTTQADMLQFSFCAITPSQNFTEEVYLNEQQITSNHQLRDCYLDSVLFVKYGNGFAWNKVIRRSFIEKHHLRYENQRIQQDEVFNLMLYPHLEKLYQSSKILYNYYIYDSGNNRSKFIPNRFDIYISVRNQFERLRKAWKISDSRFDAYLHQRFFQNIHETLVMNMLHPDCPWGYGEQKQEIKRVLDNQYSQDAILFMKKYIGVESALYLHAIKHQCIFELQFLKKLFFYLRKIRNYLR